MYLLITDHFYLEKALGLIFSIQIKLFISSNLSEINWNFSNRLISLTLIKTNSNFF